MKRQKMVQSSLFCEDCGAKMIIPRKEAQKRELNHVKHMHCYKCKEVKPFIEKQEDSKLSFWEQYHEQYLN